MDKSEALKIACAYTDRVVDALHPRLVVMYGSHAYGTQRDESDIDIAVIFDDFSGDWMDASVLLWTLRRGISYYVEPILLDIKHDKSGFAQHILQTGEVLYNAAG